MTREKEVVGDAVGDEQGGEAGVMPDQTAGGRERAEALDDLAEGEEHEEAEEWGDGSADDGGGEDVDPEHVNDGGAGDEQGVGSFGVRKKIGIGGGGEVVEAVADFRGDGAEAKEGLGPEPEEKGDDDEAEAQEPQTPGWGEGLADEGRCGCLLRGILKIQGHDGSHRRVGLAPPNRGGASPTLHFYEARDALSGTAGPTSVGAAASFPFLMPSMDFN